MPRSLLGVLVLAVACLPALAQAPSAEAVKAAVAKFKDERADAVKTFTPAELAAADEQAAKAEAALAAGNVEQAGRLITDARWQLPVQQKNLPENVSRVLGAARLRHGDRVNALAYSPDGSRLASASRDGTVRVWDVGNGRELAVYRGHEGAKVVEEDKTKKPPVEGENELRAPGVTFSGDGKRVASAGSTEIHIWEADTAKPIKVLKGHTKDVLCVAFAPKSPDLLLSGGADKKFLMWDVTKDKPTYTSDDMDKGVEAVAFSADERYMAAADAAGKAVVFAVGKWDKPLYGAKVLDKNGALKAVAFSRDSTGLVVGGDGGQLKVVGGPGGPESGLGNLIARMDAHAGAVNGVGLTADGKLLVSVGETDRTVIVWEMPAGKQIRAYQTESSAKKGTCLTVRPDGRQIAAGFESGQIRLFPLSDADDHRTFTDSKEKLMAAAYSPDGKRFATAGGDAAVRVYDTATGAVKELKGHKIAVTALAWVSNTTLASGGADKLVKVWDVTAGTSRDAAGHTVAVLAVATDPAGKVLLSGGADKSVRGWNPSTGEATKLKYDGTSAVCAIAVSPDGKRAAVGLANGKLQLFAVKDDALALTGEAPAAHSAGVAAVAFHPTADKVATCGGDGAVRLWTTPETGTPNREREYTPPFKSTAGAPPMPVTSVAFSPDGKQVVAGGAEGVARIWDTNGGGEVRGLRGHTGWVTSTQFSPDGKAVLACSVDASARLFDLPRGEAAATTGHSAAVTCVAVSRDGKYAATGSGDMTVKVWDLASGREVATLTGEADKGSNTDSGIMAVVFVGNDRVAACGYEKVLRTWSFAPAKLVGTKTLKESGFVLAADPDGKAVGVAWVNISNDKTKTGFDLYPVGGDPVSVELASKGKDDVTTAAALSPDAKWGVIGGKDGVISIWDVARKERLGGDWPLLNKTLVMDMGVTPDRKTVVVIDEAGEVKVGDTTKREVTASVKAVSGEVRGVVVAPTADRFATLCGDGTVKAWDMGCKEVRTWKLPHAPTCAVFTADGKRLITGNQDGTAFVLELPAK